MRYEAKCVLWQPFILLSLILARFQYDSVLCVNPSCGVNEIDGMIHGVVLSDLIHLSLQK